MANKDAKKIPLPEGFDHTAKTQFNEKRADMFDRFRVINSFNDAHTASRFYKNRPSQQNFTFDFVAVSS